MKKKYNVIEKICEEYIEKSDQHEINIEKDPKILKNTLDMDIRENIPPQLMSIVAGVVNIIEVLEKGEK